MRAQIETREEKAAREGFTGRERIPEPRFQGSLFATIPTEPNPSPAGCEHPKESRFPIRNLFELAQMDDVCGLCNATVRTYLECGDAS